MSETIATAPAVMAARKSRVRHWLLALILFLSTVAYADRSILSMAGSGIRQEFGLSAVQLGFILSAFSWAYVVGQIPAGCCSTASAPRPSTASPCCSGRRQPS